MKKVLLTLFSILVLTGCESEKNNIIPSSEDIINNTILREDIIVSEEDMNTNYIDSVNTYIVLGNNVSINGTGATVSNNVITIKEKGFYHITGTLNNGYIIVDSKDLVYLVLDNVFIKSTNEAPIFISSASKTVITLINDNYLEDGSTRSGNIEEDTNGVIYSKDDLVINGDGNLKVVANYEDGIVSKDGLKIVSGNIDITSKDDSIRGKDYVLISGGTFNITSNGDGIKATNDSDSVLGFINIAGGTFSIESFGDGLDGQTDIIIENGTFNITTIGNDSSISSKGIKGVNNIIIYNCVFNIDSTDDSIHSNNSIAIKNGIYNLATLDDGIHADKTLSIDDGEIIITKSYEGLESTNISINGGSIDIVASDDGINAAGGNDSSGFGGGRSGNPFTKDNGMIVINNGYIHMNTNGDGLDANGSITMNDGVVIINGPSNNGNGSLDYDNSFIMNGGTLIAVGSSGMSQNISNSSSQLGLLINFTKNYSSSDLIYIEDSKGNNILTFSPLKNYQSILLSTSSLKNDETYNIYIGGSTIGEGKKGIYSSVYTKGSKYQSIKLSGIATTIGKASMNGGGMRR